VEVLLTNENLSNEVINDIEKIMLLVLDSPIKEHVDINDFNTKMKSLKIVESNVETPVFYNRVTNTMEVNPKYQSEHYDYQFLITKEVLSMLIPENSFMVDPKYKALERGIRDNFAEALVGNNGKIDSEEEKVVANLFAILLDN
jgi:hypothetical protein